MKKLEQIIVIAFCILFISCQTEEALKVQVFETSRSGNQLKEISDFETKDSLVQIKIDSTRQYQSITGIGGSFTEASAHLLSELSQEKRNEILQAYFGDDGAKYSLTRTHINSCDFSLSNYAYSDDPDDKQLEKFSIDHDKDVLIPMIKDAMNVSSDGFKIMSSPWTAPPYMKDNNDWKGGKLLPEYYDTWALFFSKYIEAYSKEDIDIWAITVENEPLGNGNNWESMHYTPEEMTEFVKNHLGPRLRADHKDVKIFGYDQNREELNHWVDVMYADEESAQYYDGTAVHWYASTFDYFPSNLQYAHKKAPNKYLIQSEGCVDAEVPHWKDDDWYWQKEATDWGWDWAPEKDKHYHPKYRPVYRYARDMIGCFNNWVDGWIDWNMVLDKQGGPNWFKNWCVAPVIVDTEADEIYYTPLYYVMCHFSKYIRPGDVVLASESSDEDLMITAVKNDDQLTAVLFNLSEESKSYQLTIDNKSVQLSVSPQALQTIVVPLD